ncbi:Histidine phosphatase superfamily, clade-1 [Ostreococcus tauri]|uniref:Histidine phosphatase superfamily, clade-1 n=1 Tax=Ostreococcus tauri TaxID=70448 RepID=A0A090M700_OSTTA|nr:Histidine phosphatase superfamily, clade-1 [Ostreococcus tauri]CEF97864.1 Histidine phosphatase superfamily, clade-1 [Ostreococcus tauri]|eukprot:XP_022838933.1 Histidine phosphatase superfamily, clade-1 [Ostreococcus tauri]
MGWVRTPPSESARDVAVVPLGATKTVYLIRHAEGFHNEAGEKDPREYGNEAYADARLTRRGWGQCEHFRRTMERREAMGKMLERCELVVVSPLTRAMETCAGMFGTADGEGEVLMAPTRAVEMKSCERPAMRRDERMCRKKKFLALEMVREQIGGNPCDRRRTIDEYRTEFPGIDFSLVEENEDVLWKPGKENREPENVLRQRCRQFLNWCFDREETDIIVVTHSAFMCNLMVEYCLGGHQPCEVVKEHLYPWPKNCECRPLVIVDTRRASPSKHPFYHAGGDPEPEEYELAPHEE